MLPEWAETRNFIFQYWAVDPYIHIRMNSKSTIFLRYTLKMFPTENAQYFVTPFEDGHLLSLDFFFTGSVNGKGIVLPSVADYTTDLFLEG